MLNHDLQLEKISSPGSSSMARPAWADVTGLVASIGCAIHCAAMPIIIGYLPALGLGWVATQGFHQAMAIICSLIAIAAFVPGWRKHKKFLPAMLGLVGIALLTSHAFGSNDCCADADVYNTRHFENGKEASNDTTAPWHLRWLLKTQQDQPIQTTRELLLGHIARVELTASAQAR